MANVHYRAQMNDIAIEVTDDSIRSDLWDFRQPVAPRDIRAWHVDSQLHAVSTLVLPAIALAVLVTAFWVVLARPQSLSAWQFWFIVVLFGWFCLYRFYRFAVHRRHHVIIETKDGRTGVLFFTQNNGEYRAFRQALENVLEGPQQCASGDAPEP